MPKDIGLQTDNISCSPVANNFRHECEDTGCSDYINKRTKAGAVSYAMLCICAESDKCNLGHLTVDIGQITEDLNIAQWLVPYNISHDHEDNRSSIEYPQKVTVSENMSYGRK